MSDLLAASTQEPVTNGSRTKRKPPRVVESPENGDEPGPSRQTGNTTANFPAFGAENVEDNDEDASDAGSATDEVDLKNYTMKDFKGAPVGHSSSVDRIIKAQQSHIDHAIRSHDAYVRTLIEVGVAIEEVRNNTNQEESDDKFEKLNRVVIKSLDEINLMRIEGEVWTSLANDLKAGEIEDLRAAFLELRDKAREPYMQKSDWAKFKSDKLYSEFRNACWEVNHSDVGMPPMSELLARRDDEGDDDIEAGGATTNYICPLTVGPLKDAHISKICQHFYTGDAIKQHIKACPTNKKPECPLSGCSAQISLKDIVPDPEMQKRADKHFVRLEQRREEQATIRTANVFHVS